MPRRIWRWASVAGIMLSLAFGPPVAFGEEDDASMTEGTISIVPGGTGSGHIESQPAGIDCSVVRGSGEGTCTAFFPAGTVVQLVATPVSDSNYQGFRGLPGCHDPANITVFAATNIYCQPGLRLRV